MGRLTCLLQVPPRQSPLVRLVYRPEPPSTPPSRFPCAPQCAPAPPAFSLACACSPASPHRDRPCDRLRCLGLAHMPPFSSHISPPPPPPSPPSLPPPLPFPSPLPPSMTRAFFYNGSEFVWLACVSWFASSLQVYRSCRVLSGAHWVIAVPVAGSQPPPTPTRSPPSRRS